MGDGTGCDNMTAVIAKLKSGAFTTKSVTSTQSEANSEAVKRPNEDSTESCPVAKKAKTEINDSTVETTITASDEVKKEEGTTKSDWISRFQAFKKRAAAQELSFPFPNIFLSK